MLHSTFNCSYLLILCLLFASISSDFLGSFESQAVMEDSTLFNVSHALDDVIIPCIHGYDDDTDFFDQFVAHGDAISTDDGVKPWTHDYDQFQGDWSKSYFDPYDIPSGSRHYRYRFFSITAVFPTSEIAVRYRDRVCVPLANGDSFNQLLPENGFCRRNISDTRIRINPLRTPGTFFPVDDLLDLLWMDIAEVSPIFKVMDDYYLHVIIEVVAVVLSFIRKKGRSALNA